MNKEKPSGESVLWSAPEIIDQRSFVNGIWVSMEETGSFLHDPNTGEIRQPKKGTKASDVNSALESAHDFYVNSYDDKVPLDLRAEIIEAVAVKLDDLHDDMAQQDSINMGGTITTSKIIASALGNRVRGPVRDALDLGASIELGEAGRPVTMFRKPVGPVLIVGPWNAPTFTVVGKVAAAFMAGCPVILKPSENAPSGCQIFSELLVNELEERAIRPGFFQLIQGNSSVGELLTTDPRIEAVSFTGGVTAGRKVAMAAGKNLNFMQMELGSYNPVIVREDADIAYTAKSIVEGTTRLNGQWCEAPGKILVHASIHDALVDQMRVELNKLHVGHSLDPQTQVGPIAFERQLRSLQAELDKLTMLGGELIKTDSMPDLNGWFMAPGMVIGTEASDATEELFGPLITVHKYTNEVEAIRQANAAQTGLDAFVFSEDVERAMTIGSHIRAGEVRINGTFMSDLAEGGYQSFWGNSGIGGHSPQYGVRFFLGDRVVGVDRKDFVL